MAANLPDPIVTPIELVPIAPTASGDTSGLAALLQYEGDLRRQASVSELLYFIANESRRVISYEQMFVFRQAQIGDHYHVVCVSSLATMDRNAPLIQAIEKIIIGFEQSAGITEAHNLTLPALSEDPALAEYPFEYGYWQPLKIDDDTVFAGFLFTRSAPFTQGEAFRIARIAETSSHAWRALTGNKPVRKIGRFGPRERKATIIAVILLLLFPVRMSALAPAEIVAARPFVVSAPFSGVIARIHFAPNAAVKRGQTLITFDDVKLSNELKLAEEKLAVARARTERATSTTFGSAEESGDISTTRAEYDLAQAEYKFARDIMDKTQIKAPRDGMVIYGDRRDWEGRAVNVGDPIMQLADPNAIAIRIDLPAAQQMALPNGAQVKVWLDAHPLWAVEGKVENSSYQARKTSEGVLAFAVTAKPLSDSPRIGSRGTAKLYGRWVPFGYSLFRRPIASLRQMIGI